MPSGNFKLGNSAWDFFVGGGGGNFSSREFFGFWFLPPFDHPSHLKIGYPPPPRIQLKHEGRALAFCSLKVLLFLNLEIKYQKRPLLYWCTKLKGIFLAEQQSWPKGFGTPPLFQVFFYGICSYPAIHNHKQDLDKIFPHPSPDSPWAKLRSLACASLTCNSQHCPRGRWGKVELHFPNLKHKVSQTFWPGLKLYWIVI